MLYNEEQTNLIKNIEDFYIEFSILYRSRKEIMGEIDKLLDKIKKIEEKKCDDLSVLENYLYGLKYRQKREFKTAIEKYRLGLIPNIKKIYNVLLNNGIGNCYRELGCFVDAAIFYNIAFTINTEITSERPFDKIVSIFVNYEIGNLSILDNNYKDAEKYYLEAIKYIKDNNIETIPFPFHGLGFIYYHNDDYNKAKEQWNFARKYFENRKETYKVWEVGILLKEIEKVIISKEEIEKNPEYKVNIILKKTKEVEKELKTKKIHKNNFLYIQKEKLINENYLQILRHLNSYTPIRNNFINLSRGGGYYLNIENIGIVIDPGYNFIKNFIGTNHKFYEIDKVFISNAHIDNAGDIEAILSLLYRYNQKVKGVDYINNIFCQEELDSITVFSHLVMNEKIDPDDIDEEMINNAFNEYSLKKFIDFYMPLNVYKKYSEIFSLYSNQNYSINIVTVDENLVFTVPDKKFSVIILPTNDSNNQSVGFCFNTKSSLLLYTGNTGYLDETGKELGDKYKELITKLSVESQIDENVKIQLIAHFGNFQHNDWLYPVCTNKRNFLNTNNLGRVGLIKLIEKVKPMICFISEFNEEFNTGENHVLLAHILKDIFSTEIKKIIFFPADMGLRWNFNNKIEAIEDVYIDEINENNITYKIGILPPESVCCQAVSNGQFKSLVYFKESIPLERIEKFINCSSAQKY